LSKRPYLALLSVLLGSIFVFSAWSKFSTIEFFELAVVDSGFIGWTFAPFAARIIISIEFFTGILLILNIRLKEFTLWLSSGLLACFTLYLFYSLAIRGNHGNCNCFGELIPLNPVESILKNCVLLLITLFLFKYHPGLVWKKSRLIIGIVFLLSFASSFIGNPPGSDLGESGIPVAAYPLDLGRIYANPKAIRPSRELREGKHIIAFFSLKCPYCIMGGYKLHLIHRKNPDIPIYFIVNGKVKDIAKFLEETKAYDIPQTLLLGEDFKVLSRMKVPSIFYVDDSRVVKEVNPVQLNQEDIEQWLGN
jgi:hypothetical protein